MTVKQRVPALKFLEKQKKNPDFAKKMGIEVKCEMKSKRKNNQMYANH